MAEISYQGPFPLPTIAWHTSLPWPSTPFAANAPAFNASSGTSLYMLDSVLPSGSPGVAYIQTLTAGGGSGGYSFALTSGALPPGLTLSTSGNLSGTPTTNGSATFSITLSDALGATVTRSFSLTIATATSAGGSSGFVA